MPTHSILSTGPLLADPEPIDDTQTGGGSKTPGSRTEPVIAPAEDVMRIGEDGPGTQTGGTGPKTGRDEEIQPETED